MPGHMVEEVPAVLLTGGSAFGLDTAGGVQAYLEERGRDVKAGDFRVSVVPTAVVFDPPLSQGQGRPDKAMGQAACVVANAGKMPRGNMGAGCGATIGKLQGLPAACKGNPGAGGPASAWVNWKWGHWRWSTPSATCWANKDASSPRPAGMPGSVVCRHHGLVHGRPPPAEFPALQ
ncbi:hypothetical protein DFAR_3800017 [Desulfarculales bacterium]